MVSDTLRAQGYTVLGVWDGPVRKVPIFYTDPKKISDEYRHDFLMRRDGPDQRIASTPSTAHG